VKGLIYQALHRCSSLGFDESNPYPIFFNEIYIIGSENDLPTNENDVPTNENDLPTTKNDLPTNENDLPTNENDVPTGEIDLPTNENDVPTTYEPQNLPLEGRLKRKN